MTSASPTNAALRCPVTAMQTEPPAGPTGCPVSPNAAAFDPFSYDYQEDPPEYLRWSRDEEPVFWSPELGYWVVTRYEDTRAVFRDHHTFSPSIALEKITPTGEEANQVLASYGYAMNRTLVNEDEPEHMLRRRALMEPFTPGHLAHHEPLVRQLTREYVDRFVDTGRIDLVEGMLWEIPLTVALNFLGVPEEDMDTLRKYSIAHTVNTWGRPAPEKQVAVADAVGNFWQYAGTVLEKMRQDPDRPGWMPFGIRKQAELPEVVTDSYLHSMMMAGIVAAHETTANASANAIKLLLENREVWEEICADPALIPNAVEECLRHNGSVAAWRRLATVDTEVGGVKIPAGSKVLIITSSANHDERHFEDPDRVDIRRDTASDHMTFGYGSHQCMGKNLARMEMQIFLEELTRRLPHLRLAKQEFTYVPNTSFRGPEHLWVEWDPALNPERRDPALLQEQVPVRIGEPSMHVLSRAVVVEAVDRVAEDVIRLRLASLDGRPLPGWTPGSHIDVECGDPGVSRQYSLCGDPAERSVYEVAVLCEHNGRGGSQWVHGQVQPGDRVAIRGPRNHFRLDESAEKLVLVAGGIGITPIMAMAARAKEVGLDYELHYLGRSRLTMAFVDDMETIHGRRMHVWARDRGSRVDLAALLPVPDPGVQIYACGPQRLLDGLSEACAGWDEDNVRFEHFSSGRGELDPEKEHAFELVLKDSGITVQVPAHQTVLQALRTANVDVSSDCEEGLCGSCEIPVVEGEVDHRDVVLTAAERRANERMMSCCSRACGRQLVVDL